MTDLARFKTGKPRFEAEIIFPDPYEVRLVIEVLNEAGFDCEVLDLADGECELLSVWVVAMCEPNRNADEDLKLWDKVRSIVEPFGGDANGAGTSDIPIKAEYAAELARWRRPVTPEHAKFKREMAIVRKYVGIEPRVYPRAGVAALLRKFESDIS